MIVIVRYVLHEMEQNEIVKLLTEIRRVLRFNGTLLVMHRTRDGLDWVHQWMLSYEPSAQDHQDISVSVRRGRDRCCKDSGDA